MVAYPLSTTEKLAAHACPCGAAYCWFAALCWARHRLPQHILCLQVALRIGGLGLVYAATWTYWPLSSAIMGVLAATVLGPTVSR